MKSIKDKIKKSFSKSFKTYDRYAVVQDLISEKLINRLKNKKINSILEIGTGTGNYAVKLKKMYPDSKLYLIDFSKKMLSMAEKKLSNYYGIKYIIDDAENMDFNKLSGRKFDLITSNSTFQWFENLNKYLTQIINFLSPGGVLLFSYFGNKTFIELNEVLKVYYNDSGMQLPAQKFISAPELEKLIKSITGNYYLQEFNEYREYPDLLALLKEIRGTGEYGYGTGKKIYFTKKSIKEIEKIYRDLFQSVIATYNFYIVELNL